MHDDRCSDLPTLCFRVPLSLSLSLRRPVREFSLRSDSGARMSSCSRLLRLNRIWDSCVSFCAWAEPVERRVTLGHKKHTLCNDVRGARLVCTLGRQPL